MLIVPSISVVFFFFLFCISVFPFSGPRCAPLCLIPVYQIVQLLCKGTQVIFQLHYLLLGRACGDARGLDMFGQLDSSFPYIRHIYPFAICGVGYSYLDSLSISNDAFGISAHRISMFSIVCRCGYIEPLPDISISNRARISW